MTAISVELHVQGGEGFEYVCEAAQVAISTTSAAISLCDGCCFCDSRCVTFCMCDSHLSVCLLWLFVCLSLTGTGGLYMFDWFCVSDCR